MPSFWKKIRIINPKTPTLVGVFLKFTVRSRIMLAEVIEFV